MKADQPTLHWALERLFADEGLVAEAATARTVDKGHGRLERRRLWASPALAGYAAWPGLAQALRIEREVVALDTGELTREQTFAVTSLPPERAGPRELMRLWRGHWQIENRLHWVRDVGFGEDRSGTTAGAGPQAMAALRNTAIGLLRAHGATAIAAARRRLSRRPAVAAALLGLPSQ